MDDYEVWYWIDNADDGEFYAASNSLTESKGYCNLCFMEDEKITLSQVINQDNKVVYELQR